MKAASLLATAVASLPKELQGKVLVVDDFTPRSAPKNITLPFTEEWGTEPPPRLSPTAPARTKGKAIHKQQARKAQRRNK